MSSTPSALNARRTTPARRTGMPLAARTALGFLERLDTGRLHVGLPDGSQASFGPGGLEADIEFHDWAAFGRILRDGDIGFAEGFLDGQWDTPHLPPAADAAGGQPRRAGQAAVRQLRRPPGAPHRPPAARQHA
jgi:hypothetical protein